jgi:hypothetical protein
MYVAEKLIAIVSVKFVTTIEWVCWDLTKNALRPWFCGRAIVYNMKSWHESWHVLSAGKPSVAHISERILCVWCVKTTMIQFQSSDCICVLHRRQSQRCHIKQLHYWSFKCSFFIWSNSLSNWITYMLTICKWQCSNVGYLLVSGLYSFSLIIFQENVWNKA